MLYSQALPLALPSAEIAMWTGVVDDMRRAVVQLAM